MAHPFCRCAGVGLESSVGLIVASLDLRLVRLVRAAMHPGNGPHGPDRLIRPGPTIEPRKRHEPEPVIEPRKRHEPEPVFEPRPVHRPVRVASIARSDVCVVVEVQKTGETSSGSPIEPPWKVLPWERASEAAPIRFARPVQRVKLVTRRPDIPCSGSVIDVFI